MYHLTIDFLDDVENLRRPMTPGELDQMMAYLAHIGISRVYWIHYHDSLLGHGISDRSRSPLVWATEAAHRHGMQLFSQLRVFETGLTIGHLPWSISLPDDLPTLESLQGRSALISPFVHKHPQMRVARRPGSWQTAHGQRIHTVKLVKSDDAPTRLTERHLQIWSGTHNGVFRRYEGPVTCHDSIETRDGRKVRVLALDGLTLPVEHGYVAVRSMVQDDGPAFANRNDRLMELYDQRGNRIPSLWDQGVIGQDRVARILQLTSLDKYGDIERLADRIPAGYGSDPAITGYYFNLGSQPSPRALDGDELQRRTGGFIAHARGKNAHLVGSLNPIHQEVRQYWLESVQATIDAGADGVTVRVLNHSSWTQEKDQYGYDEPTLAEYVKRHGQEPPEQMDFERLRDINGEAFTQFLVEARDRLHRHSLPLQVHVCSPLCDEARIRNGLNHFPLQFRFNWREWIERDILDEVLLKCPAASFHRKPMPDPDELTFLDEVAAVAKQRGKAVFFEARIPGNWWNDPEADNIMAQRIEHGLQRPTIDGINIYEAANVTRFDRETGKFEGSDKLRHLVQRFPRRR